MATRNTIAFDAYAQRVAVDQFKPQVGFIRDALFGILRSRDTMLASWARALREPRRLIHTEKRLSNGLKSARFDDRSFEAALLDISSGLVQRHCDCIAVDETDLRKNYGRKMPFLAWVHDGSKKELCRGWVVHRADGISTRGTHVPLHSRVMSREDPGYRDDHDELRTFLKSALRDIPASMPIVFDRGYDDRARRKMFKDLNLRSIVRLKTGESFGARVVVAAGRRTTLEELVARTELGDRFRISKFSSAARRPWLASVGWTRDIKFVSPRGEPEPWSYSVVVIHGHVEDAPPMVLLTSDAVHTAVQARQVAQRYFSRWGTEECHRLMKAEFGLENLRALTWQGIKRIVLLVHAAFVFLATLAFRKSGAKLAAMAPGFGRVPRFPYYRLAELVLVLLS